MAVAPGLLHLNERATHEATLALLESRHWDVVVLQAQNYSLSGTTNYPNDGSVSLVRSVRERGGLPILFAEWPRRGIDETQIILDTYRAIAVASQRVFHRFPRRSTTPSPRTPDCGSAPATATTRRRQERSWPR